MTAAFTWAACTASATVLKTGTLPSNCCPPFPGVTPATTFVPYSIICLAWKEPSRPVMPWTTRRVRLSMKMLTPPVLSLSPPSASPLRPCRSAPRSPLWSDLHRELLIRTREAQHHRDLEREFARRLDDAVRDVVGARDAAEDIEQDDFDARIGRDDAERADHLLRVRAAADVEEVRGVTAVVLHEVHRRHCESGAVDAAADIAVELDEREPGFARRHFFGRFGRRIAQRGDVGPAIELVVVDGNLGVECLHHAVRRRNQRVDLGERRADVVNRRVQLLHDVGGGAW